MLYAYAAKIIITWALPKGGVSYNISLFSCFGIITYLISYPLHNETGIIKFFARIFFKILLLPLALLSTSIGIRVYEYGITESRYMVMLCTAWLILSCIFSFTKYKKNIIKFIYISIVTLLLIAAFLPLSTNKTIEINNQEQKLK